jgi:hypothetical protein
MNTLPHPDIIGGRIGGIDRRKDMQPAQCGAPQTEIDRENDMLGGAVRNLEKRLAMLTERLQPICHPAYPTEARPGDTREATSPLGISLQDRRVEINALADAVDCLLGTLAL